MQGAKREGVFLADVRAVLIDDGEPVGVWVLREADIGAGLRGFRAEFDQVFLGGLGRVREVAGGFGVEVVQFDAQCVQEVSRLVAAGAVDRVNGGREVGGLDQFDIDEFKNAVNVVLVSCGEVFDALQVLDLCVVEVIFFEAADDVIGLVRRRRDAVMAQRLDAVPWEGVVAGGDDHAAVGAEVVGGDGDARGGEDADTDDVAAG